MKRNFRACLVLFLAILAVTAGWACGGGDADNGDSEPPTLVSIAVTPPDPTIDTGGTQQFTATGTYSDGTTKDVTSSVTWISSDLTVALINETGLATPKTAGSLTITAAWKNCFDNTTLTITAQSAALSAISVTPANPSIGAGATRQFTATGTYADSTTKDLTSSVTWSTSNAAIATISSAGLATGVAAGSATITAASGAISGTTTLTVTPAWTLAALDTAGSVGTGTSIAVDANGKVHIGYLDRTNSQLKYATNASGARVLTAVAPARGDGYGASLAIGTDGKVHICYEGTGGNVMYATNASGSWATAIIEASTWSYDASLALDSGNKAHVSYFHATNFDLKYATNASGVWTNSIIVNGGSTTFPAYSTSIDLDSSDRVHISYYDDQSPDSIKYITNASGSWQVTAVAAIGLGGGWGTSLVVDSADKVHISYYNWTDDELRHATNASGTWQTEVVDGTSGNVSSSAIAVDAGGTLHLAYKSNSGLMYATNPGGSWAISNLDASWTGGSSSIAVDGNGGVHVSYYDGYELDLKYAVL